MACGSLLYANFFLCANFSQSFANRLINCCQNQQSEGHWPWLGSRSPGSKSRVSCLGPCQLGSAHPRQNLGAYNYIVWGCVGVWPQPVSHSAYPWSPRPVRGPRAICLTPRVLRLIFTLFSRLESIETDSIYLYICIFSTGKPGAYLINFSIGFDWRYNMLYILSLCI